jgi:hypothetical protein
MASILHKAETRESLHASVLEKKRHRSSREEDHDQREKDRKYFQLGLAYYPLLCNDEETDVQKQSYGCNQ